MQTYTNHTTPCPSFVCSVTLTPPPFPPSAVLHGAGKREQKPTSSNNLPFRLCLHLCPLSPALIFRSLVLSLPPTSFHPFPPLNQSSLSYRFHAISKGGCLPLKKAKNTVNTPPPFHTPHAHSTCLCLPVSLSPDPAPPLTSVPRCSSFVFLPFPRADSVRMQARMYPGAVASSTR